MSLNCPICGKKYFYDRKICQECEDSSIYSGLITTYGDGEEIQKWNCGIFLEDTNSVFGKRKSFDSYFNIASTPKTLREKNQSKNAWNCSTTITNNKVSESLRETHELLYQYVVEKNKLQKLMVFE